MCMFMGANLSARARMGYKEGQRGGVEGKGEATGGTGGGEGGDRSEVEHPFLHILGWRSKQMLFLLHAEGVK